MKVEFKGSFSATSRDLLEARKLLIGVWAEASEAYCSRYWAFEASGKKLPLGVQPFLNKALDQRFHDAKWFGSDGRYTKSKTWFRVTFRHQMSLGSDFIDGLLLAEKEGIEQIVIAAPSHDFAKLITPRDANSIVTFEKLEAYFASAKQLFRINIAIARLSAASTARIEVDELIRFRHLSLDK